MQHGPILRDVDLLAAEHGVDVVPQPALLGQGHQKLDGLVGDAILGVIQEQAGGLQGHLLAALGIVGEEPAEVQLADFAMVGLQGLPRWPVNEKGARAIIVVLLWLSIDQPAAFYAVRPAASIPLGDCVGRNKRSAVPAAAQF